VQYTVHWDDLHSIIIFNPNLTQEGMGAYSRNPHTASTSLQRLTVSEIEIINVPRQSKAHHHHPLNEKNGQFLAISKANDEPSPCTGQALA